MKTIGLSKKILILLLFWPCMTWADSYVYSKLMMKPYDEMLSQVKEKVKAAERISEEDPDVALDKLKDALQLIFSRPDRDDNMVSQLVPVVRTPLRNLEKYEITVKAIASKAIDLARSEKSPPRDGATAIIVLGNIMGELKPEITSKPAVRDIFVQIRDAKIKIHRKVKSEFRLGATMKAPDSPSDAAAKALKSANQKSAK